MELFKILASKAKRKPKIIILPESYDKRVIAAAKQITSSRIARIILIRTDKNIPIRENNYLDIIDIGFNEQFTNDYFRLMKRRKPDYNMNDAGKALNDPMTFACMLLKNKFADAVVAGAVFETSHVIRSAIQIIGMAKHNNTVSSFFLFTFPKNHPLKNRVIAYADCGVVPNPNPQQLSDIAIQTAANFKRLTGTKPRVAFLSFSTKGSANDDSLSKIISACRLTTNREKKLICEGELQFDAAFVPMVAERKNPGGKIKGDANVFIFPDLNAGNIAYKITERIGGASATGPIVQGLAKPVMDLSRGCSAQDIMNMILVASAI